MPTKRQREIEHYIKLAKQLLRATLYRDAAKSLFLKSNKIFERCQTDYGNYLKEEGKSKKEIKFIIAKMAENIELLKKDALVLGNTVFGVLEGNDFLDTLSIKDVIFEEIEAHDGAVSKHVVNNVSHSLMDDVARSVSLLPFHYDNGSKQDMLDYKRYLQVVCIFIYATSLNALVSGTEELPAITQQELLHELQRTA